MITKTINNKTLGIMNGTIQFPNEYCFAFNPNYIEVDLEQGIPYIDIEVTGSKAIDIRCSLYKGKGKCYISRLMQLMFDEDLLTTRIQNITINVSYYGNLIASEDFTVIWGCIRLGDPFGLGEIITKFKKTEYLNGMKHIKFLREVKWFKKFPFSVSFFAPSSSDVLTQKVDGKSAQNVSRDAYAIFEITPTQDALHSILYNINVDKELLESTFTAIFDETFSKTYKFVDESVNVTVSNETEGYYIRWIDQFGFIQYWLFRKGDITHKNKLGSNTKQIDKSLNGIYYGNIERVTSIENTETIKCAAVNLNENMVRTVETIIKSPYIDLFLGYNQQNEEVWLPINIVAGSHKVTPNKILQNYEIQFTMPDTATQTL
jgi:hypothetical protein